MELFGKEHYEIMAEFEKQYKYERLDKESKGLWNKCIIYQDGNVNNLFIAFRRGYSFGKTA